MDFLNSNGHHNSSKPKAPEPSKAELMAAAAKAAETGWDGRLVSSTAASLWSPGENFGMSAAQQEATAKAASAKGGHMPPVGLGSSAAVHPGSSKERAQTAGILPSQTLQSMGNTTAATHLPVPAPATAAGPTMVTLTPAGQRLRSGSLFDIPAGAAAFAGSSYAGAPPAPKPAAPAKSAAPPPKMGMILSDGSAPAKAPPAKPAPAKAAAKPKK